MKSKLAFAAIFAALLLGALLFANHQRQQSPFVVLGSYPKTPCFTGIVNSHLHPSAYTTTVVLSEDSFDRTLESGLGCSITRDGNRECWAGSQLWGSGHVGPNQSTVQLDAIRAVLRDMPTTISRPAPENLLIVGYWQDEKWTTQIYDKSRLPWRIKRLRTIMGLVQ